MSEAKIRPGGYWYLIGAAVLVLSVGAFVWGIFSFIGNVSDSMGEPFTVPGAKGLRLSPGTYNILLNQSDNMGRAGAPYGSIRDDLRVKVIRKDTGKEVPVRSVSTEISYNYGSRRGKVLWDFPVEKPGFYVISGSFAQTETTGEVNVARQATLSVGPEMGGKITWLVLGILLLLVGGLGSLAIFIVTPILRGRCKRRLAAAAPAGAPSFPLMPPSPPSF